MNRVMLIGNCTFVSEDYLVLKVDDFGEFKLFFNEVININYIEINKLTKVEGQLVYKDFPFPVVEILKVFQLKDEEVQ